ncbi:hypothetical protein JZU48_05180, partial [bacterium]|nr:hypothetical protein [bacterium]
GFMALGWLMDRVLQVLTLGRYDPLATGAPFYSSAEWGYLLLNAMVLAAAAGLVLLIITKSGRRSWGVTGLVLVLLVANPVTRAFFWTAHTQMFNLLVPPLAIYLASLALKSAWSWQRSVTIGVLLGLGLTT